MSPEEWFQSLEEEVSSTFVRRLHGEWTPADQVALENRLTNVRLAVLLEITRRSGHSQA